MMAWDEAQQRIDQLTEAIRMTRAASSYPFRDQLGLTDLQAQARMDLAVKELTTAVLRGVAAEEVCRRWAREAEADCVCDDLKARYGAKLAELRDAPQMRTRQLPVVTRTLRRKVERQKAKARNG